MASVLVGIPTYKRPNGLAKLLDSLGTMTFEQQFEVIVADNDTEAYSAEPVVEAARGRLKFKITYIKVPQRGIAQARNTIVEQALCEDKAQFLAMIDDDEWASEKWLANLIDVQEQTGADLVSGPVFRVFESEAMPEHVRKACAAKVRYRESGIQKSLESSANILFSMNFIRRWDQVFFDTEFSMTGGSDRDLFQRMKFAGAVFAWSSEASVEEWFPVSRANEDWLRQRYFRIGNSEMLANMKNKPGNYVLKEVMKITISLLRYVATSLLLPKGNYTRFSAHLDFMRTKGKFYAIAGNKYFEYTTVHGS